MFEEVIEVSLNEKPLRWTNRKKSKQNILEPKINKNLLKKYSRGKKTQESGVKTKYFKEKIIQKEEYIKYAVEQSARTEILLKEEPGSIVSTEEENNHDYKHREILKNVDITAASKHFNLSLDFGPYTFRYNNNGRHLLLGGRKGHVAAFDWITKKLHCEMNVMEEIADISWLHLETMFACAQKNWVHIYDNRGTEIHCVKKLYSVNKLEFLPYHFLLAAASSQGYLSWLDISIGEIVGHYNSKLKDIRILKQNPANGVLCTGGGNGVVSMWSPKVREPLAKMLCHSAPMSALAVDHKGIYLGTSGLDRKVKVWDIRELNGPLAEYSFMKAVKEIDISQKNYLALASGNQCEIYSETINSNQSKFHMKYNANNFIYRLGFCPYEDVLGIATEKGFISILVPGSGEPNFDALEANPFRTKSQRREHEVHSLLEKLPPEFISLEPNEITGVDVKSLKDKNEAKKKLLFLKPQAIDFKSRRKMKGKKGSVNANKRKQIVKETMKKETIKEINKQKKEVIQAHTEPSTSNETNLTINPFAILDRFKSKSSKNKQK